MSEFISNVAGTTGGAIQFSGDVLDLVDCVFLANSALGGGGVNTSGSVVAVGRFFVDNQATGTSSTQTGGALCLLNGSLDLTDCVFDGNNCTSSNCRGGAVAALGTVTTARNCSFSNSTSGQSGGAIVQDFERGEFYDCTFTDNTANGTSSSQGGALRAFDLKAVRCSFVGNQANRWGGAIYQSDGPAGPVTASSVVESCVFDGNSAPGSSPNQGGGALFSDGEEVSLSVVNSLFTGNTSNSGTIHTQDSAAEFVNCTLIDNQGGIYDNDTDSGGPPPSISVVRNCILRGNGDEVFGDDAPVLVSYSNVEDMRGCPSAREN